MKIPGSEEFQEALFFGSSLWKSGVPIGKEVEIEGTKPGIIHEEGLLLVGSDGNYVNVKKVKINGKKICIRDCHCKFSGISKRG